MEILINPWIATAVVGGGIFLISFLLGRSYGKGEQERIIAATIDLLRDEGYVKWKRLPDGEIELIKIDAVDR